MGCYHEHEFVDQFGMQTTITDSQAYYNADIYRDIKAAVTYYGHARS